MYSIPEIGKAEVRGLDGRSPDRLSSGFAPDMRQMNPDPHDRSSHSAAAPGCGNPPQIAAGAALCASKRTLATTRLIALRRRLRS